MKPVRCAIYTRKSSEEGLEQSFNSLDAQREACSAYILSQASEGWSEVKTLYDDGGLSGGTLERPALQRLLADVADGKVDIIVVYKVDRLTRSLLDFAKLVEALDKAGTSFVSVTQSFNTTTSMGRLTLNMLLSFAQFEREVTAERIRDKLAASKAKGMWMGGMPPIGYKPNGRTLDIVDEHAEFVRLVFQRYLELGNVRVVAEDLERSGHRTPERHTSAGKAYGGGALTRGQIYKMLTCPLYIGRIKHKDITYPGLHQAIIEREVWDRTQALLADNLQGHRRGARAKQPSLLAGKLVDDRGRAMIASHTSKGTVRYRYYISRDLQEAGDAGIRIPAREIEGLVMLRVNAAFEDRLGLAALCGLRFEPGDIGRLGGSAVEPIAPALLREIISRVRVLRNTVEVECSIAAIATKLGMAVGEQPAATITLSQSAQINRLRPALKLVQGNGAPVVASPFTAQLKLLAKAHLWWRELRQGKLNITEFAARQGVTPAYVTRILRLAFLSPKVTEALLTGSASNKAGCRALREVDAIVPDWRKQERMWLGAD